MDKYECIDLRGFFIKSIMNERRCCHLSTRRRSHTEDVEGTWTTSNTSDLIKIGQMMWMDISHQANPEKISTDIRTGADSGLIKEIKKNQRHTLVTFRISVWKWKEMLAVNLSEGHSQTSAVPKNLPIHQEKCVESSDDWIRSTVGIWGIKRKHVIGTWKRDPHRHV